MTKYEVPEGRFFLCVVVVRWVSTNYEVRSTGRAVFLVWGGCAMDKYELRITKYRKGGVSCERALCESESCAFECAHE